MRCEPGARATYNWSDLPTDIDLNANIDTSENYNAWLLPDPDGLVGTYEVGIWNVTTDQLLASTWVGPDSTLISDFRYSAIAPTTLAPNTSFIIAALLPTNPQDQWLTGDYIQDSPDFSYGVQALDLTGDTLGIPTTPFSTNVELVNGSTTIVASAPEPTTAAYIVLALGCLGLLRLHRKA